MNVHDERSIEEHVCKALLSWLRKTKGDPNAT